MQNLALIGTWIAGIISSNLLLAVIVSWLFSWSFLTVLAILIGISFLWSGIILAFSLKMQS